MSKYLEIFVLLLSIAWVNGSPVNPREEIASNLDEKNNEVSKNDEVHRLSDNVVPSSYVLKIVPDLTTFTFSGEVVITVTSKNPTNQIELHGKKLTITNHRVMRGTRLIDSEMKLDEDKELIVIQTSQSLNSGTEYTVVFKFNGVLSDNMEGFYKSSYVVENKEYWLATTQFETTHAREAFPCFDEPGFRAKFSISVAHFPNQKATSNMPVETPPSSTDSGVGNRVWTKFQQTPPMATYLVAFMVSEFQFISSEDKKISVWTRENAIKHAPYSLKQSVKLLKALEDYTGIPYALPKLDVIAIPDFDAGAMENWGMTTYRENCVIVDELTSAARHEARVTRVISHEFSHQWFGDFVTPIWWDYLWLNEGFARYFEYFAASDVEPTWRLNEVFIIEVLQSALRNEINTQRAMTTAVKTQSQIDEIFDVISYAKGASIIRMFEHMVTTKVFKEALHNYLRDGAEKHGGTVNPGHLFEAFDNLVSSDSSTLPTGVTTSQIMKTWTENIGFPLIAVKRNYETKKVEIKQVTYQSLAATKPAPEQQWIVPLTYTTKSERQFSDTKPTLWSFAGKVTELPKEVASGDWVLLNLKQTGYYRVNYDWKNWYLLIDQLNENPDEIHVLNRAQLIDDAFALYEDKKMCHPIPFKLVQYLPKETDMIPWYSAVTSLYNLYSKYEGSSGGKIIREFILNIIRPAYLNFGFGIKPTDGHLDKVVKSSFLVLACKLGLEGCYRNAFEEYKNNEKDLNKVQPDLKGLVYCEALRQSADQQKVFDNLWSTYLKSEISWDKNVILSSLGCATNVEVVKTILSKLFDSKNKEIRKQDRYLVKMSVFGNIHAITSVIQFLINQVSAATELNDEEMHTVKIILNRIQNNIKIAHHIHLLKELETKLSGLDQQKYGEFTNLVQNLQTKGAKKIEDINANAEKLSKTLGEFLPSSETSTPPSTTGSGSSALVSSLWTCLPIILYTLYHVSPAFYVK